MGKHMRHTKVIWADDFKKTNRTKPQLTKKYFC